MFRSMGRLAFILGLGFIGFALGLRFGLRFGFIVMLGFIRFLFAFGFIEEVFGLIAGFKLESDGCREFCSDFGGCDRRS